MRRDLLKLPAFFGRTKKLARPSYLDVLAWHGSRRENAIPDFGLKARSCSVFDTDLTIGQGKRQETTAGVFLLRVIGRATHWYSVDFGRACRNPV
jgi:hypothetical protein